MGIPPKGSGRPEKYAMEEVDGDGKFFKASGRSTEDIMKSCHAIKTAAYRYAKKHGVKFTCRVNHGGVSVYREGGSD